MMNRRVVAMQRIPAEAVDKWVEVPCDCDPGRPHTNEYHFVGESFLCMTAPDEDGVVFKWQVLLLDDGGSKIANGWGHTPGECHMQAEMTAQALTTDRAAYYEQHPELKPTIQ